jgi:hypothetical protein
MLQIVVEEVVVQQIVVEQIVVTSLPTWRDAHRAEKYEEYFDFKQLRICTHVEIYYNFI